MAQGFLNRLIGKIPGNGLSLQDRLLGQQAINSQPLTQQYPSELEAYLNDIDKQDYMQGLLNQPKETGLTLDQYKEGIAQGLNFGIPQIAEKQKELGIVTPKTAEEVDSAKLGEFNKYPSIGLATTSRVGGILPDLVNGYRENYATGFAAPNLMENKLDDGRNKGFAYRAGELLGSVGRFVDSPLGRGLIAGGLTKALGYDNPLQEGLTAVVGRQNAQTADKVYRQQLKQMGYSDDELNNIGGNITDSIYKNLASNVYRFRNLDQNSYVKMKTLYDRQLQQGIITPEEYKMNVEALNNQYINSQIQTMQAGNVQESNQTRNTNMNEQLLPYKQYALQMSPQIALGNLGVAQGNLALNNARLQHQIEQENKPDAKLSASQKDAQSTLSQIGTIRNLVNANKNATGLNKGYVPGDIINRIDKNPENIKTRTAIDALRTKVRHDLTGAQFSPKEAREYERFLPTNKDNADIINAKLDALEQRYYADFGVSLTGQTPSNGGINIDKNALEAEMKRRGLK